MGIVYGTYCDIGDIKKINQDNILAVTDGKDEGLFIVADGCGGLSCGDKVSSYIITEFRHLWDTVPHPNKYNDMCTMLSKILYDINDKAREFGSIKGEKVGSTIALLYIHGRKYASINVGDSRVYSVCGKKLKQISSDQSVVADMIRRGEISKSEAKHHKRKNVLTMCVGLFERLLIVEKKGRVPSGGKFLICSDGLYNFVDDKEIVKIVNSRDVPQKKVRSFRECIPNGEARDNISAIIVETKKRFPWAIVPIVTAALAAAAYIVWKFVI